MDELRPHRRGFDSAYYLALSNNQTTEVWREDELVLDPFERDYTRYLDKEFLKAYSLVECRSGASKIATASMAVLIALLVAVL